MLEGEQQDLMALVGAWRLLSVGVTMCDTKERWEPFGPNPDGHMVLEPGGRIMFLFTHPDRMLPMSDADQGKPVQRNDGVYRTGSFGWPRAFRHNG